MRKFEKISLDQFIHDTSLSLDEYNFYDLPKRSTKNSAGYDFMVLEDFDLKPNEKKKIYTGIKANFNPDEVLLLIIRSSLGAKYDIRMCNQVGVIDSDYYNNKENEGHIIVTVINCGDKVKSFTKGERFCQGIFTKFLTVDDEKKPEKTRNGGFGSTSEEEK